MIHPNYWILPWGTAESDVRPKLGQAIEAYLRYLGYKDGAAWIADINICVVSDTSPTKFPEIGGFASTGPIKMAGIIDDSAD